MVGIAKEANEKKGRTFSRLSQLYCFGAASSVLLPRGTALVVVVVSTVVVVGVLSSFSNDFRLDFFE